MGVAGKMVSVRGARRLLGVEVAMVGLPPAPLRPLGVAEILDGAVRLARRNARSVLIVSVPYALVATVATALLQYGALEAQDAATAAALGTLVLTAGLATVLTGLLAPLYTSDLLGVRSTTGDSLRRVGRRALPLLLLGLVISLGEGAGLLACLVGGVWLWGIWAVAAPAFVLERAGVRAALGRSRALVAGSFWRVWGIRALGWLLTYILSQLIVVPFDALAAALTDVNPLDTSARAASAGMYVAIVAGGQLISSALLSPVTAAIDVLLYTDLRMRKEGMDIVLGLPARPEPSPATRSGISAW